MAKDMRARMGLRVGWVALVMLASSMWLVASVGEAASGAHAAKRRSLTVNESASLRLTKKSGNVLYERGTASGTLPGAVSARFVTSLTKVTGTVTFYPRSGGSLTMTAIGYPRSTGTIARFSGNLAVRGGTGRWSRALGSGTFSGTVNRRTWAVTVQANARLTY